MEPETEIWICVAMTETLLSENPQSRASYQGSAYRAKFVRYVRGWKLTDDASVTLDLRWKPTVGHRYRSLIHDEGPTS